ncbi:uncharacterized protein LOC144434081 [Glandiceps talaboti]
MEWTDPTPLPVNNIGYSTGWGSNGEFKFCVDEPVQECTNLKEFSTDTTYQYRYLASSSPVTRVDFKAKAKNDVHIALSDGPEDKPALYEIVIGGWGNTQSVIRRSKQGNTKIEASTPSILSPTEFRGFWITYNNGVIKVGKEGQAAFMEWTDPTPLPVNNIGYSTGWGSNGEFKFCVDEPVQECTNLKEFSTDTTYQYRYLASSSPVTRVDFKAKANNDVHIALSDGPEDKPALYEIVIGGWGNTQSVIRRSKQGNTKVEASTPSILSPTEFRGFWITYNNGVIKVGKEGHAAFMEWTDPTPLPVNNIGYSTGWGSNGEFKFCVDEPVQECTNLKEFSTDTTYQYRYLASSSPVTRVDFKAKAKNDVHIALSDGPEDKPALYEIVIGGWGNTQSVIRRSKQGNTKIEASTPSILSPTEFRGFWITYNNGVIKVGKEGQAAFMEWTDPTPLPVNNIGYSTGWGSNGEFKFCVDEPVQECTNLKEFSTDTTYQYRYLASSSPVTRVDFKAKANNDVHIALSDGPEDKPALYEIVIGGWGNTQSVIRRSKQGNTKVEASTPSILSPTEFRGFWITYNNGVIKVGKEGHAAFMEWTDPTPLPVNNIGYSTGWGSNGEFKFCVDEPVQECTNLKEFSTDTTYQYRYLASSSPVTRVDFKAKAKNDVHIALSDGPEDKPALYEIVIGGWGNTQSVIRRSKQGNTKIEASTPSILSPTEFRGFWITYNNGVIKVGKEGQAAFMEWTDPTPLPVNNIGYSTGWGSNGEFKFCVDEPVQVVKTR